MLYFGNYWLDFSIFFVIRCWNSGGEYIYSLHLSVCWSLRMYVLLSHSFVRSITRNDFMFLFIFLRPTWVIPLSMFLFMFIRLLFRADFLQLPTLYISNVSICFFLLRFFFSCSVLFYSASCLLFFVVFFAKWVIYLSDHCYFFKRI